MDLLKQLVTIAAVPGREHRLRQFIREQVAHLFDDIRVDALGSLICVRKPRPAAGQSAPDKPTKVMLAAHIDQIGFLVRYIDDKGFIRVNPVGGFDTRNLFARLCTVCPDVADPSKDITGVFNAGGKPIHIAADEDRKKVPDINEFVIDLGLPADEVKQRVRIGDMVVLNAPLAEVGSSVASQCLDNRVASWILIRALEKLKHHSCEIHAVFTVQEEVGLRGAGTAAYDISPDLGIAIDTTLCCDTPGVPDDMRVTEHGKGAALTVMDSASIADPALLEQFEAVAQKHNIKHQRSILPRGGTDSGAIQRAGSGVRTFTLSCPTRYIHTVTEMVHLDDLHACRDLLAAWLAEAGE